MSHAREAAETVEAIENALNALETCREQMTPPAKPPSFWVRYWEPAGEGGAAIEGLKFIRDRLRARGN